MSEKASEEPKSIRKIHIRFSDLTTEDYDPFIRYWIKVYNNRRSEGGIDLERKYVRFFVKTGANVNTISRRHVTAFLEANLDLEYVDGLFGGLEVRLMVIP